MSCRVHIGHHFFGAGNIGDDLMLAGFLRAVDRQGANLTLSCCIPHPLAPMRLRFPHVEWLPCEPDIRRRAIARADVWLGLGDTPFQTVLGDWMLDHLCEESRWCDELGRPMYYLAVGVDEESAIENWKLRLVVSRAVRIWTRDPYSAGILSRLRSETVIEAGSDLAHLCLQDVTPPLHNQAAIGLVLNYENPDPTLLEWLDALIAGLVPGAPLEWLIQEVRALPGSERDLFARLAATSRLVVIEPDYAAAPSIEALLGRWPMAGRMVTSRYHAMLAAAWAGSRTVALERSAKLRGGAEQLGVALLPARPSADLVNGALDAASPVSGARLTGLADLAASACAEFFFSACRLAPTRHRQGVSSPDR